MEYKDFKAILKYKAKDVADYLKSIEIMEKQGIYNNELETYYGYLENSVMEAANSIVDYIESDLKE